MKKEWADKWIEALRSGKYQQTRRQLRDGTTNRMCCLGVLCDIVGVTWNEEGDAIYENEQEVYTSSSVLPFSVQHVVGMSTNNGKFSPIACLSEVNDKGLPFTYIADTIEKNYEKL